jgi:hypothetical protein
MGSGDGIHSSCVRTNYNAPTTIRFQRAERPAPGNLGLDGQRIRSREEVMRVATSAWSYEERGLNRSGQYGAWFPAEEANRMITTDQDAFILLTLLRANNGPERFILRQRARQDVRMEAGATCCCPQTP